MVSFSNSELFDGKIKPTPDELKLLEEEFKFCQSNLTEKKLCDRAWCIFSFMLRNCILKKLKQTGVSRKDLDELVVTGTSTFMNRYKNDSNYNIRYPLTAAYYVALKQLYKKPTLQEQFETNSYSLEKNIETLGDAIYSKTDETNGYSFAYVSFEDDILDKLEKEGY